MAKEKHADPVIDINALAAVLNNLPPASLQAVLERSGSQPSTQGIGMEQLQMLLQTVGRDTAVALKRAGQRENPTYHARSVFNPRGRFDDDGNQLPPKVTFKYDTYFIGILIGRAGMTDDLSTEPEIELYNRFEKDMDAKNGTWTARFSMKGGRKKLEIEVPAGESDDRMGIPPLTHVLLTLLEGEESVNPSTLLTQVKALREDRQSESVAFKALQKELADLKARMGQDTPVEASQHA